MTRQQDLPKGWDAADAIADGWTADRMATAARWRPILPDHLTRPDLKQRTDPSPRIAGGSVQDESDVSVIPGDGELPSSFYAELDGIVYRKADKDDGGPGLYICPSCRVLAVSRDEKGDDFGRLLVFRDLDKRFRREVIMDRGQNSSAGALVAGLAANGFEVANHPEARRYLVAPLPAPASGRSIHALEIGIMSTVISPDSLAATAAPQIPDGPAPFTHFSGLGSLLRTLGSDGADAASRLTHQERSTLALDADTAVTSLALGVATIGKLLINANAAELTASDLYSIGDLLATLGEAINEVTDIGQGAENAQTFAAGQPGEPDRATVN